MQRFLTAIVIVCLLTPVSLAHAVLLEAKPTANGVVAGPDISVELRFNSRIDSARSRLTLVLPDHTVVLVSLQPSTTLGELKAQLNGLHAGAYTLRWQVLASDGHITRGEIPFEVK
jgi:methionine-rich copper-binding protein CopC